MVGRTRIEEIHDRLAAFYPVYTDQGSVTRIVYADTQTGKECSGYDLRQVESVTRALARCYAVDLRAQAKLLRERYGQKIVHHFHLPDGRVYVPFKLRKKQAGADASYGYVGLNCIERLVTGEPPLLMLRSGTVLPLCSRMRTARHAFYFGQEIKDGLCGTSDHDLINALNLLRGLLSTSRPAAAVLEPGEYDCKFTRRI